MGFFEYLASEKKGIKRAYAQCFPAEATYGDRPEHDKAYLSIGKWRLEMHATYFSTSSIAAFLLVSLRDRSTGRHCGSSPSSCGHVGREGL
jgi:hypothetical protein